MEERYWIFQIAASTGNFHNLETYIQTGKRGDDANVIWEIFRLSPNKIHIMTLEEAVEWVGDVRAGKTHLSPKILDDLRLYHLKTSEVIPCTGLLI